MSLREVKQLTQGHTAANFQTFRPGQSGSGVCAFKAGYCALGEMWMCFDLPYTLLGGSTCLACLLLSRFPDILSVPKPQGPHISCLNDLIGVSPASALPQQQGLSWGNVPVFSKGKFSHKIFFLPIVFYIFQVGKGLKSHDTNYSSFLLKILHRLV